LLCLRDGDLCNGEWCQAEYNQNSITDNIEFHGVVN
jgi:hypothetical protein